MATTEGDTPTTTTTTTWTILQLVTSEGTEVPVFCGHVDVPEGQYGPQARDIARYALAGPRQIIREAGTYVAVQYPDDSGTSHHKASYKFTIGLGIVDGA